MIVASLFLRAALKMSTPAVDIRLDSNNQLATQYTTIDNQTTGGSDWAGGARINDVIMIFVVCAVAHGLVVFAGAAVLNSFLLVDSGESN